MQTDHQRQNFLKYWLPLHSPGGTTFKYATPSTPVGLITDSPWPNGYPNYGSYPWASAEKMQGGQCYPESEV